MRDLDILKGIKKHFNIKEFIDSVTYDKHGEKAWKFIDIRLLHTMLVIRTLIGRPITINNWAYGGKFTQRGLRTNVSSIVSNKVKKGLLYLSAHVMGKAVDFDVQGMTADEVRDWIIENEVNIPYKIRLEHKINKTGKTITWVHLDVFYSENNPKVYLFNV